MRSWLLVVFGIICSAMVVSAVVYYQKYQGSPRVVGEIVGSPSPLLSPSSENVHTNPSPSVAVAPSNPPIGTSTTAGPDLTTDTAGLSKATVIMATNEGVIKFKFYPNDAPKTVKRIIELINKGFYNGLTFHRVVPGFVIQGGDPLGNGTGGSGQKLEAEFNNRRHVEGTVAMARAADANSADSQFYISLSTLPHLDHNYTVFGQVIEGMDVVKKIKVGDKMTLVTIQ